MKALSSNLYLTGCVCMFIYIYIYICVCVCVCVCVCAYVYVCLCIYIYRYVCMNIYLFLCIYIYIYIYNCTDMLLYGYAQVVYSYGSTDILIDFRGLYLKFFLLKTHELRFIFIHIVVDAHCCLLQAMQKGFTLSKCICDKR